MPAKVSPNSKTNAYQQITNASGNQGDPLSFLTTFQADKTIAPDITSHKISPSTPISTTSVPNPLSTLKPISFALKKRATYCVPSEAVPIPYPYGHRSLLKAPRKFRTG